MRMVALGSAVRANDLTIHNVALPGEMARCFRDSLSLLHYCIAIFFCLCCAATAEETWLPPTRPPVEVVTGFFLANLSGAAERSETFEADLYLTFRWQDPRLAFAGTEPKRFLEDAAGERSSRW